MTFVIIAIVVIVVILAIALITSYNRFVKQRNLIQESWRQIDVELHRRYDLIPNLVETVRAYAAHERHVFEEVARLRTQAVNVQGATPEQRAAAEGELSGALRQMMISVEAYPQLQSNQNFLGLQRELTDTEDRIAAGRRFYNANVGDYNTRIEAFPSNVIAGGVQVREGRLLRGEGRAGPLGPAGLVRHHRLGRGRAGAAADAAGRAVVGADPPADAG